MNVRYLIYVLWFYTEVANQSRLPAVRFSLLFFTEWKQFYHKEQFFCTDSLAENTWMSLFQETTIEENPVLERTNLRRTMYSREALLKDDEEDEGKWQPLSPLPVHYCCTVILYQNELTSFKLAREHNIFHVGHDLWVLFLCCFDLWTRMIASIHKSSLPPDF